MRKAKAVLNRKDRDIRALVIGGGAIGLGAALSCQAQGIKDVLIVEPNDLRRAYIATQCAQTVTTPQTIPPQTEFDLVVDGVGYEATRKLASEYARAGGVIAHIGLGSNAGGIGCPAYDASGNHLYRNLYLYG